jgi:anti-sigma factor RsiW
VELVTAYLEDALPVAERARFEAHISRCDACTTYLEQMRLTLETIGRLGAESLSPQAARELGQAFREWRLRRSGG